MKINICQYVSNWTVNDNITKSFIFKNIAKDSKLSHHIKQQLVNMYHLILFVNKY